MINPIAALPDCIKIAGFDIRVEKWDDHAAGAARRWGEFSAEEQLIRVQLNIASRFKAVDTFLHEVSHAIYWAYGIHDGDSEERIVCAFGSAWMQVHRDNPWLAKWLSRHLA